MSARFISLLAKRALTDLGVNEVLFLPLLPSRRRRKRVTQSLSPACSLWPLSSARSLGWKPLVPACPS